MVRIHQARPFLGEKTMATKIAQGRARRQERQEDAVGRQESWNALALKQRIAIVQARRGESKKELARLNAALAKEK
jgi:hypothetical protein